MGCSDSNARLKANARAIAKGAEVHPVHNAGDGLSGARQMVKRFFPPGGKP